MGGALHRMSAGARTTQRRAGGRAGGQGEAAQPRLDAASRILSYRGASVTLTPAQCSVVLLLAAASPSVASSAEISQVLSGYMPARETSVVRTLVSRLRRVCEDAFGKDPIETVLREGYRLREQVLVVGVTNVSEK